MLPYKIFTQFWRWKSIWLHRQNIPCRMRTHKGGTSESSGQPALVKHWACHLVPTSIHTLALFLTKVPILAACSKRRGLSFVSRVVHARHWTDNRHRSRLPASHETWKAWTALSGAGHTPAASLSPAMLAQPPSHWTLKKGGHHPLRSEFLLRPLPLEHHLPSGRAYSSSKSNSAGAECGCWQCLIWFITLHTILIHCLCNLLLHCYLAPFNKMSFWVKQITAKSSLPNALDGNEIISSALLSRDRAWTRTASSSSRKLPEYSSPWGPSPLLHSQNALFSLPDDEQCEDRHSTLRFPCSTRTSTIPWTL